MSLSKNSINSPHFTRAVRRGYLNNYNGPTGTSSSTTEGWPDSVAGDFAIFKHYDIELVNHLGHRELEIQLEDDAPNSDRQDTNPQRETTPKVAKVIRTVHTAKIAGMSRMFTVVGYEAEGGNSSHAFAACKAEFEYWLPIRGANIPRLFGVTHPSTPALIFHNARINAVEVFDRYKASPVIWTYLRFLHILNYRDVYFQEPRLVQLGGSIPDSSWDFAFSTREFHYNLDFPINPHVKTPPKFTAEDSSVEDWEALADLKWPRIWPRITPPALDDGVKSIIDYLSCITGEYLDAMAVLGLMTKNVDPLEIALDGLIPFGACFQRQRGEERGPILASFQYTEVIPKLEWSTKLDVKTCSVNSYMRISFPNRQQGGDFIFRARIAPPLAQRQYFRRAFLSQSLVFMNKVRVDPDSCYLLDSILVTIKARFEPLHKAASADPVYLFVGPFEWEDLDGMLCLKCPLDGTFARWSLDPDSPSASFDADSHGLPQLEQEFRIGTQWDPRIYQAVEEYLHFNKYNPYRAGYAKERKYPLLTYRNSQSSAVSAFVTSFLGRF